MRGQPSCDSLVHTALQAALEDVEDLEADARPEDLMMSYVSGEKGKVQSLICVLLCLGCLHQLAARGWPHADWCCGSAELPPEHLSVCPCLAAASPSADLQWRSHWVPLQVCKGSKASACFSHHLTKCSSATSPYLFPDGRPGLPPTLSGSPSWAARPQSPVLVDGRSLSPHRAQSPSVSPSSWPARQASPAHLLLGNTDRIA